MVDWYSCNLLNFYSILFFYPVAEDKTFDCLTVLNTAARLRSKYPDVHFQFYSSDAIDVLERLEHGSIDFAIFLEPIDISEYNYISLPESSRWGVLMPSDCELAENDFIEKKDILKIPLIFHRRAGLQQLISHWADTDDEGVSDKSTHGNVV